MDPSKEIQLNSSLNGKQTEFSILIISEPRWNSIMEFQFLNPLSRVISAASQGCQNDSTCCWSLPMEVSTITTSIITLNLLSTITESSSYPGESSFQKRTPVNRFLSPGAVPAKIWTFPVAFTKQMQTMFVCWADGPTSGRTRRFAFVLFRGPGESELTRP